MHLFNKEQKLDLSFKKITTGMTNLPFELSIFTRVAVTLNLKVFISFFSVTKETNLSTVSNINYFAVQIFVTYPNQNSNLFFQLVPGSAVLKHIVVN